jgi:hypothetical protein
VRILGSERSRHEVGALAALVAFGIAGLLGLIAVLDTDDAAGGFAFAFASGWIVFLTGGATVCALACLARGRAERIALASILITGIALDLLVLAIWLEIDDEWYGKTIAVGLVWSFLGLIAFGLVLAVTDPGRFARWPFYGALGAAVLAGLVSTYLVVTAGTGDPTGFYVAFGTPIDIGSDELLRVLGAAVVLLASLWFCAVAAHRYEQAPRSGG